MTGPEPAKQTIADLLDVLRSAGGLRFDYVIETPEHAATEGATSLEVTLSGPDTALLLERNGELLHAIASLAAAALRLTPEQQDQLSFDAEGFKAARAEAVRQAAEKALESVRSTGQPFVFAPMNSRERRMLHLVLSTSGLATASSGMGPRRFVVLYPAGVTPAPERFEQPPRPSGRPGNYALSANRPPEWSARRGRNDQPSPYNRTRPPSQADAPRRLRPPPAPSTAEDTLATADDTLGNRKALASQPPTESENAAATEARLESIRRAFRKR